MDTIFKKTEELVRNNPADFKKTTQSITKKILKNNHPFRKSEVLKRFRKIWPDSKGKKVIVIGWLLSDSAIGTGAPSVPTALAEILTERISNADNNLNPANLQEWIRGTIFHQEESKQRLEDAVRAYETENPLKDESAGTAVQQTPAERNGGKAEKTKTKEQQWRNNTPDYMLLTKAIVTFAGDKPAVSTLSKKITPDGPIHYMRKGRRCKVHIGDFRDFINKRYPTLEFANEIADEVLADREAMREKIDRQKKTGK